MQLKLIKSETNCLIHRPKNNRYNKGSKRSEQKTRKQQDKKEQNSTAAMLEAIDLLMDVAEESLAESHHTRELAILHPTAFAAA